MNETSELHIKDKRHTKWFVLIYHVSYIGVAVLTNIFEVVEEQDPDCEHEGGEDDEDHTQPAVHGTPHTIRLLELVQLRIF